MHSKVATAAALAAMVAASAPALAHHSYAMFDRTRTETMKGTVRTFEWTNPHAYLWVNSTDDKGQVVTWGFEFIGGVNGLARNGWTRHTLNPGDKVTVTYNPLKDGRTGGEFYSVVLPDGKTWDVRGEVPPGGRGVKGQINE